jgi:hypothetical protein
VCCPTHEILEKLGPNLPDKKYIKINKKFVGQVGVG